jgi:hypothetical protein
MIMLFGELEAFMAGNPLPKGPLFAPICVRFFVRLRAILWFL